MNQCNNSDARLGSRFGNGSFSFGPWMNPLLGYWRIRELCDRSEQRGVPWWWSAGIGGFDGLSLSMDHSWNPLTSGTPLMNGVKTNKVEHLNLPFIWGISLVAAMGGLLFGYDFVVIGGAKPFYEKFFLITSENVSGWAVSCALVGCLIGAIVSGGLSDRYGRKKLLILSAFLFATSSIGTGLADDFLTFVIWRIIGGIAIGLASNLSPMYIAEIAPANLRGRLVAINQLTIVIGSLTAQIINWQVADKVPDKAHTPSAVIAKLDHLKTLAKDLEVKKAELPAGQLLAADIREIEGKSRGLQRRYPKLDSSDRKAVVEIEKELDSQITALQLKKAVEQLDDLAQKAEWWEIYDSWNGRTSWRWMFGLTAVPSVLFFLLMFFVPESPRWLAKNGKPEEAQSILGRIGGSAYAHQAIGEIEATLVNEVEKVNFRELLEPKMRRALLIGVVLAVFQQWCGINLFYNYPDIIFTSAGYSVSDLMFNIVVTGIVNLISMLIAMFIIDRFGRRFLMLAGSAGLACIYFLICICLHFQSQGFHLLSLIIAAIACFAFSLCPPPGSSFPRSSPTAFAARPFRFRCLHYGSDALP